MLTYGLRRRMDTIGVGPTIRSGASTGPPCIVGGAGSNRGDTASWSKRILVWASLTGLLASFSPVSGQNTGDCFSAIPVCQGVYSETNSPPGEGDLPDEIDPVLSCLGGGEVDGQWYTFTVQNSGQFCFSIIPNNLANDYDWAVFNLTNASCSDIFTNGSLEVSCNFSGIPGVTGANGQGGTQNNPCIPMLAGQSYVLYVSNWSQSAFGYTLDLQLPGSTASVFDAAPPTLVAPVVAECDRIELGFSFSEQVQCNSVQPADIAVTGPGGPYTVVSIASADCLAGGEQSSDFVLTLAPPLTGTGPFNLTIAGEVLDLCGNTSPLGGGIPFTLDEQLVLEVTMTPTGCGGPATGTLTATAVNGQGPFVYRLNGGSPQVGSGFYDELPAGNYTLSVLDSEGCTAIAQAVVDVESDLSNTLTVSDVSCAGAADGMAIVETSGSSGSWNYTWRDDDQTIVRSTLNSAGDTLITGPGTFTVVIQETNPGVLCADTLVATITEAPALVWSTTPGDTTICINGTAVLSASAQGGAGNVSLNWSSGLSGNGPHPVGPVVDTEYSVQAVDANGCTTPIVTFTVQVNEPLSMEPLTPITTCNGQPFTIDLSSSAGGDGDLHFLWSNGAPDNAVFTDTLYTDGTVCVTLSDGCETPSISSCTDVTVLQTPPLVIGIDSALGCVPFEVSLGLVDTTGGARIVWDFGDGVSASGADTISYIYTLTGSFDVTPTVTWPNGCVTDTTLQDLVRVIPVPAPDFAWDPSPLTIFEPTARFIELAGPNEVSYDWDFFAFGTSEEPDPVITFPNDIGRYYPVQLIVTNELGCSDTVLRQVHVEDQFLVYVPNAFSPNGDGINDTFRVEGNDIGRDEFHLRIFDRWGSEVFATEDRALAWNGANGGGDGDPLPEGVYTWRLQLRSDQTLQKRILYGHVTLLR